MAKVPNAVDDRRTSDSI